MNRPADEWIRWTTAGYVALLAGTVSYLHMHLLVEVHGQTRWVAALAPLSVDGIIVAASTTLLADSWAGSETAQSHTLCRIDAADQLRRGEC